MENTKKSRPLKPSRNDEHINLQRQQAQNLPVSPLDGVLEQKGAVHTHANMPFPNSEVSTTSSPACADT